MLYNKDTYLNKNFDYIISNELIEYDMQEAGFNLVKYYNLLSYDKISFLESLTKKERHKQIGIYQRDDKEFARALVKAFREMRKLFFESNNIIDENVLSIKKDAILMLKRCNFTEFNNVKFIEKNKYTSYYYINEYEFYYNKQKLDVKGISDEKLISHKEFMLDFLSSFFYMMETNTRKNTVKFLKDFCYYYKNRQLEIGYYKELNSISLFRTYESLFKETIGVNYCNAIELLDIGYNYIKYAVPLISILI